MKNALALLCLLLLLPACSDDDPALPPADPADPAASVRLETLPAGLEIGWTLSGPEGFLAAGAGDTLLTDLVPGEYAVTWTPRAGWVGAADSTAALAADSSLGFGATYRERRPFADSPAQLLANYIAVYEAMDAAGYRELLHPDFRMALLESTTLSFPELGEELDFGEETTIHDHLFGGEPGRSWDEASVRPVVSIDVQALAPLAGWKPADPGFPFAGTMTATCDARFRILLDGYYALLVVGRLEFHAATDDSLHLGVLRQHWRLAGLVDLGAGSKLRDTEYVTLGTVKAVWR